MEQFRQVDDIALIPIKRKPKAQELLQNKLNIKRQQSVKKPISKPNPKRMDLKMQASLLNSLKFVENIQPDVIKSSLKNDFTEWEHQNFVFKLSQQSQNSKVEYDDKINQYFNDFNQKWKIYPYKHFVDLKPETDHVIMKQPLCESKIINQQNQNQYQIKVIPLRQSEKLVDIKIKLELQ